MRSAPVRLIRAEKVDFGVMVPTIPAETMKGRVGSKVEHTYRHTDFLEQRGALLKRQADFVTQGAP